MRTIGILLAMVALTWVVGCSSTPKPLPECRGTSVPINGPESRAEVRS